MGRVLSKINGGGRYQLGLAPNLGMEGGEKKKHINPGSSDKPVKDYMRISEGAERRLASAIPRRQSFPFRHMLVCNTITGGGEQGSSLESPFFGEYIYYRWRPAIHPDSLEIDR